MYLFWLLAAAPAFTLICELSRSALFKCHSAASRLFLADLIGWGSDSCCCCCCCFYTDI